MRRISLLLLSALACLSLFSEGVADADPIGLTEKATALLRRVDDNLTFDTRSAKVTMTVSRPRRDKAYTLMLYSRGRSEGAAEFLEPARDAGTKMLKLGDTLRLYLPSVERVQLLSGHMLRDGVMGGDLSYEDLLEATALAERYDVAMGEASAFEGRACQELKLTARAEELSYPTRSLCVDGETGLPLKQELYASSGLLLKTWTMHEPVAYGERWFPARMVVSDALQPGNATTLVFEDVAFSVPLAEEVFSERWLER